jgi:hypothetical protein
MKTTIKLSFVAFILAITIGSVNAQNSPRVIGDSVDDANSDNSSVRSHRTETIIHTGNSSTRNPGSSNSNESSNSIGPDTSKKSGSYNSTTSSTSSANTTNSETANNSGCHSCWGLLGLLELLGLAGMIKKGQNNS